MAKHELKLLNVSVIFYLLAGALIFHSLGEFDHDDGPPPLVGQQRPPDASKHQATARSQASDQKQHPSPAQVGGPKQLSELRLRSVRRMWNITNQLNILYESNWTELVLAELVEFERQLIESLESGAAADWSLEDGAADKGDDPASKEDKEDDEETKRKKAKQRAKELESRQQKVRQEARLKSLKKALVHSLATMTTMGSPVEPPRSPLGKLVTILYGSLGVPLLVISVARSGRSLARSSLNTLLILRHYCFALPFHYLCCSCNLFACLRWLSWCCCCCCCSYLCCLGDSKQKCCDSSRAPQLKLVDSGRKSKRRRKLPEHPTEEPLTPQAADSTSFVIGFKLPNQLDSGRLAKQPAEQQKSVRFSSGQGHPIERAESKSNHSNLSIEELSDLALEDELAASYSDDVFATSLGVLFAYVACGAYYISRTQELSMVDALFSCYSMLATSSLPDAFEFGPTKRRDPLSFYYKLTDEKLSIYSKSNSSATKLAPTMPDRARQEGSRIGHSGETLLLGTIYLLIGLNLISTCAHYARLRLARIARKRRSDAQDCLESVGKANACNGLGPGSHPLIGSFDRAYQSGLNNQCDTGAIGRQVTNRQQFATSPMGQQLADDKRRTDMAELFVLPGDGEREDSIVPITCHSDGSFAASDGQSSSTAPRSLCVHHQSALAFQAMGNSSPYETNNLQLENAQSEEAERSNLLEVRAPSGATIRASSSVIQIANGGQPPEMMLPDNRLSYNYDTNSLRFKNHQQAQFIRPNGFTTLSHSHSANEQDSSPNTFETTNSQTISSLSGRALVLKRPPAEMSQTNQQQQNSIDAYRDQSGRGIWFNGQ